MGVGRSPMATRRPEQVRRNQTPTLAQPVAVLVVSPSCRRPGHGRSPRNP
jgi:hypothetical protein